MAVMETELTAEATEERFVDFLAGATLHPADQCLIRHAHQTDSKPEKESAAKRLIEIIEADHIGLYMDLAELAPKKSDMITLVGNMLIKAVDMAMMERMLHDTQPISIPATGGSQD